jgi:hypothetical protein
VVVLDDGQPRAPAFVKDQDVELGVIGLPDLVGRRRLAAVDELEALAVTHRPLVREHDEPRVQRAHDRVHRCVARRRPPMLARDIDRLAMDERGRRRRASQR